MSVPDSAEYWWDVQAYFARRRLRTSTKRGSTVKPAATILLGPTPPAMHVCCGREFVGRKAWKRHRQRCKQQKVSIRGE